MRTFRTLLWGLPWLILLGAPPGTARAAEITLNSLPPVVVKTVPANGARNVDPSLGEIRVTFNKEMMTREMWSWVIHTPEVFPKIVGEVKYLSDKRTNVAPVKLQPHKVYAIWFNSPNYRHNAFRDTNNNPAVPYLLVFRTGG
ncbi:MAG: Ig-like domain-containing protein [Alphaproteobacteria bacterium]|nr:Ig-like domain-containing protein [Alphaproteobacteria bacterium]